ncbi:hypothetical protein MIND_00815400 [Mycena indigotica]|uniref:Uncharacterized protein n=1 Tax=Mycena indigotica TaxID=2126181 RepID=A0A8H6VYP4_9AGAR|nr:uncharacterized protein MIND_00815400 [Mycena indigotica]KAF7298682.1 hypothetical protein MIND_00815400 [Mycena indigotica]
MAEPVDPLAAAVKLLDRPISFKLVALCSSPRALPDSSRQPEIEVETPRAFWRKTEELEYIGPEHPDAAHWTDYRIVEFLFQTAVTIPPKSENRSDPWVTVTQSDGKTTTTLPRGYRVPLLWLHRVQWDSLRLLLSVGKSLWPWLRFDVLHIGRLTNDFLTKARTETKIKRQWRYPRFDRVLTRFFNGWMGCREVFIWDFYKEFKDEEYKDDAVSLRWAQKVPKGIQGFAVTEQEVLQGISAEQYMDGLVIDNVQKTIEWSMPPDQPPSAEPPPVSRGSSPLTSDAGSDKLVAEALKARPSEPSTPTPASQNATPGPSRFPSLAIKTELSVPRKKPPPKPRPPRTEGTASARPLRPRTQNGSVSSPAVASHVSRSASANNSPASAVPYDFTATVESRGRKRKISNVYSRSASGSPSPLTSDEEEDGSGSYKGSSNKGSRTTASVSRSHSQSQTPGGRTFTTQSRIVIPRLSASSHDVYSRPTPESQSVVNRNDNINPLMSSASRGPITISGPTASAMSSISAVSTFSGTNLEPHVPSVSPSETRSPQKPPSHRLTLLQQRHYKLAAIASSPSPFPFDVRTGQLPPLQTWRHAEELDYIGPKHPSVLAGAWSDWEIVEYMVENVFTIPSKAIDNKQTWVEVQMVNITPPSYPSGEANEMAVDKDPSKGYVLNLPRGYRIPLLWLARVQWDCLKALITEAPEYWEELKFDLLHLARLSGVFLAKARTEPRIKRTYRDVMFDRPLSRFVTGWMGSRDEFVYDFFREFKEEEYEDDMISKRWMQKVQKGIQGFVVTEDELNEGITAEQHMHGLQLDRENKTFAWVVDGKRFTLPPKGTTTSTISPTAIVPDEPMQLEAQPLPTPKSPLSLSQLAQVHSPSLSPLTPTIPMPSVEHLSLNSNDEMMELDAAGNDAVAEQAKIGDHQMTPPSATSALGDPRRLFDEPTPDRSPQPKRVPEPATTVADPRSLFDSPEPETTQLPSAPTQQSKGQEVDTSFDKDTHMDSKLDQVDTIQYNDPESFTTGGGNVTRDSFGLGPAIVTIQTEDDDDLELGLEYPPSPPKPNKEAQVPAVAVSSIDDVDFNESEFLNSRLPTPFGPTPPVVKSQLPPDSEKSPVSPISADPSSVPNVDSEEGLFAKPMEEDGDSESIRSSSSPEPRPPLVLPPRIKTPEVPTSMAKDKSVSTAEESVVPSPMRRSVEIPEQRPSSPPIVSELDEEEETIPVQTSMEEKEPELLSQRFKNLDVEEGELQNPEAEPLTPTTAHVVPIGASDAADEFPPGFHFMGSLPQDTSEEAPAQVIIGEDHPVQVDTTIATDLQNSIDVDTPSSPIQSPSSLSLPILEQIVSNLDDAQSKRVKLEVVTTSLLNEDEDEEPEDMDMGTPIDSPVDIEPDDQIPGVASGRPEREDVSQNQQSERPSVPDPIPPAQLDHPQYTTKTSTSAPLPPVQQSQQSVDRPFPAKANNHNFASYGRNTSYRRSSPPPRPPPSNTHRFFGKNGGNFSKVNTIPISGPRSKLFSRDREANGAPPLPPPPAAHPHRSDHPMDGRRSPTRLPDNESEYDPRRPSVSATYSMPSPAVPQAFPRWMGYTASNNELYNQPYSPLVPLNNPMSASSSLIIHPPATETNNSTDAPLYNGQIPMPMPVPLHMPSANRPPSPLRRSSSHDTVTPIRVNSPIHATDSLRNLLAQVAPDMMRNSRLFSSSSEIEMSDGQTTSKPPTPPLQTPSLPFSPALAPPPTSRSPPLEASRSSPPPIEAPRISETDLKNLETTLLQKLAAEMKIRETAGETAILDKLSKELGSRFTLAETMLSDRIISDAEKREFALFQHVSSKVQGQQESLGAGLAEKLRNELRAQLKEELAAEMRNEMQSRMAVEMTGLMGEDWKGQLKDEILRDLQGELRGQFRNELRNELRDGLGAELLAQTQAELPDRVSGEVLGEMKSELSRQMRDELLGPLKDELIVPLKAQLLGDLTGQLKHELVAQMKDELVQQLQNELRLVLQDDLKERLRDELSVALENNLRNVLRDDLKEHVVADVKDHFSAQLQDQLKALGQRMQTLMNSELRADVGTQMKSFIEKLKGELVSQLKDALTVQLQDGVLGEVKSALTEQLKEGLDAQREQLNLDFERRKLILEQQHPRPRAVATPSTTPLPLSRPSTPKLASVPTSIFQVRHPLHHLVLTPDGSMDVESLSTSNAFHPTSAPSSPSKPRSTSVTTEAPVPVKSQRKQSWFTAGLSTTSSPA